MGCFTAVFDPAEGGEREGRRLQSLRAILAQKEGPLSAPCSARAMVERKLGLVTRKTLRARSRLLAVASVNLAKAQQRSLSLPPSSSSSSSSANSSFNGGARVSQDPPPLFPLPLPPGYTKTENNTKSKLTDQRKAQKKGTEGEHDSNGKIKDHKKAAIDSLSKKAKEGEHDSNSKIKDHKNAAIDPLSKAIESSTASNPSTPSSSSSSSSSSYSTNAASSDISSELLTAAASSTSASSSSSSWSSSSSSSVSNTSPSPFSLPRSRSNASNDLRCSSLSSDVRFALPLPPPAVSTSARAVLAIAHANEPLREYATEELAGPCDNFHESFKLRDGPGGAPVYRVTLKRQCGSHSSASSQVVDLAVARVAVHLSRKKWRAQVQSLARLAHPNVCKIVGYSYEEVKLNGPILMETCNAIRGKASIVYEHCARGSLDHLLKDALKEGRASLDWATRMKIAINAAEGMSFLHKVIATQNLYWNFKPSCIQIDTNYNAKLADFMLNSLPHQQLDALVAKKEEAWSVQSDVYAFGLVLEELFMAKGGKEGRPRLYLAGATKLVAELARRCRAGDAASRPSMPEVTRCLRSIPVPPSHKKRRSLSFS